MKTNKRFAALTCVLLLGLSLAAPLSADAAAEETDPSLLEMVWNWVVDTLNGEDDDDGTGPDEGSLQIPPGTP